MDSAGFVPSSSAPNSASRLIGVKVACFFPWVPFEPTGAWARFTSLWRYLLSEGAQVTLVFLDKGKDSQISRLRVRHVSDVGCFKMASHQAQLLQAKSTAPELRQMSHGELTFLLLYEKGVHLYHPDVATRVEEIVATHDVVTCEYPFFAPFLSEFCRKHGRRLLVTAHDLIYELHGKSPVARAKLEQSELASLRLADQVVFCNEDEQRRLADKGVLGITVLNTGDAASLHVDREESARELVKALIPGLKGYDYVLFVGSRHAPNVEAALELRKLAKALPKVGFVVAGGCCEPMAEENFVTLGALSERNLDLVYRGASAVVVPLTRGTGSSLKVFQALAYGKPVVSTKVGARGYPIVAGEHALIGETPAELIPLLKRVMTEPGLKGQLSRAGRALALDLDFRQRFRAYGDVILSFLGSKPGAAVNATRSLWLVDTSLINRVGHHFNYALSLRQASEAAGLECRTLVHREATEEVVAQLAAKPLFSRTIYGGEEENPFPPEWSDLRLRYSFMQEAAQFAQELEQGLAGAVEAGDVVFFPNATPAKILGLALLLQRSPVYRVLEYAVMMRYTLYNAYGPLAQRKPALEKDVAERYALALDRLLAVDQVHRLRLLTDSEGLAKEYAGLFRKDFEVLPIPHTQATPSCQAGTLPPKASGVLRLVFMGDAREEKGFEYLPALIKAWPLTGNGPKVEFVFQALITSPYHAGMAVHIEEMERLKRSNLHLLKTPLSTSEYEGVLHSADLVLLPYDVHTYKARTSGPFMEALCAGKPVVVTKGTWMAGILGNSGGGVQFNAAQAPDFVRAVQTAVQSIEILKAAAEALGANLKAEHNPTNFLAKLMG